jgi:hypothetical protein
VALRGHAKKVYALAALRDGARLASGSRDRCVRVWATPADDVAAAAEEEEEPAAATPPATRAAEVGAASPAADELRA